MINAPCQASVKLQNCCSGYDDAYHRNRNLKPGTDHVYFSLNLHNLNLLFG